MNRNSNVWVVSCEPHTIWSLAEHERPAAVIALLNLCGEQFRDAVRRDDARDAQELAIFALASVAGLFPDPNDDAHGLLLSLVGMITGAMAGRSGPKAGQPGHILMTSGSPIIGTKRGLGHAYVGGFAISAVKVLTGRQLLSKSGAQKHVAKLLADLGYSLRKGDHDAAKPITGSAIRNWHEKREEFPFHNEMAAYMAPIHAENLARRNAVTLDGVLAYLRDQAKEALQHYRGL